MKLYICGIDWQQELENASHEVKFYATPETLKAKKPCWKECGIVEVRVNFVDWEEPQNLFGKGDDDNV